MNAEETIETLAELLQLGNLTSNESKALLSIAITKETRPLDVARNSKLSTSKIYETMNSLVEKGFLEKKGKEYDFDIETLSILNEKFKRRVTQFGQFIENLSQNYPESEESIARQLEPVIKNLGYSINFNHRLDTNKNVLRNLPVNIRSKFRKFQFPWIVSATSDTSGITVGVVIFSSRSLPSGTAPNELFILRGLLSEYQFDHTYFLSSEIPKSFREFFYRVNHISLSNNYISELSQNLDTLDLKWRQSKQSLEQLEKNTDDIYQSLSHLTSNLLHVSYGIKKILPEKVSNDIIIKSFEELSSRLEADLKALTESHLDVKLECKDLQLDLLEEHELPSNEELNEISNRIASIRNAIDLIDNEVDVLDNEIIELLRGDTYANLGFIANPFVFTIPVENHLEIIGQNDSILQLREFLTSISNETNSKNVSFIVDTPGMGKTHLMKFFSNEINSEKIPNSVGLFIRCRPGGDVISLHNEISIAIQQLPTSKIKTGLLAILNKTEPPGTINQLLSLLRNLSQFSYDLGKKGFVLFLDEFENLLTSGLQLSTSITQLQRLVQVPHIGFVIVVRRDYWNKIYKMKNFVNESSYEKINLQPFDYASTEKLLNKRLSDYSVGSEVKITFSKTALKTITDRSKGNVRKILTLARDGFNAAVNSDKNIIDLDSIVETQTTLDDIRHDSNSVTELHLKEKEVKE
ncbi:MAG: hypothetical protein K5777_04535 [Nitrosopumilus sp.]|nr:hypothetical protein [Nitrosopumilus sp.]